jgi:hypothetical protein
MAMFAIDIADADIMRVLNSLASNYNRPEMVPNPNYAGSMVPNPNWSGPMVANPDYDGPTMANPDFDPEVEESVDNSPAIPTDEPELIPNSQPEFIASNEAEYIQNPETLPVFANRIVRQFLAENVRAYEIRLAREAAEQSLAAVSGPSILDPQLEN